MSQLRFLQFSSFLIYQSCALYISVLGCLYVSLVIRIGIHGEEGIIGWKELDMKSTARFSFTLLPVIFGLFYYSEIHNIIQEEKTKDNRIPISPKSGLFVKFFLGQTGEVSILPSSHRNYSTSNIVTVVSEMTVLLLALAITIIILGFREEWTLLWKVGAPDHWIYLVLGFSMCLFLVGTFVSTMSSLAIKLARIQIKKALYKHQQASSSVLGRNLKLQHEFVDGEPKFQEVIDTHDSKDDCSE